MRIKNHYIRLLIALLVAIIIMACFVAATKTPDPIQPYHAERSENLEAVETKDGQTLRIDYVDTEGNITFASDLQYASIIRTLDANGFCIKEIYLDENGLPVKIGGKYGTAYENNADGLPVKIIYLDADGNPVNLSTGYAVISRTYNAQGLPETETYFDVDMQPVKYAGYYGLYREYDANGNAIRVRYLDADGNLVNNSSEVAIVQRIYDEEGRAVSEKYFDADGSSVCSSGNFAAVEREYSADGTKLTERFFDAEGKPVITSSGYAKIEKTLNENRYVSDEQYYGIYGEHVSSVVGCYGARFEYNDLGQSTVIHYLDADGEPMRNVYGYAILERTFAKDGSVLEEHYFDESGNPVQLSGGYYGIRHDGKHTIYLDAQDHPIFLLNQFLYQYPWVSYALVVVLCLVCFIVPKGVRAALCIIYILFILYMTLFTRESTGGAWNFDLVGSYMKFLTVEATRHEMLENVALFLPFGLMLRSVIKSGWTILAGVALSCIIELIQGVTGLGGFELNDIINNSIGMVIGFVIVVVAERLGRRRRVS